MWQSMVSSGIATESQGRQTHSVMNDPREKGFERIEQGWITDFLCRTSIGHGISVEVVEPSESPHLDFQDVED